MGAGWNRGHRSILALPQQVGGAYIVTDRERPQDKFWSWGVELIASKKCKKGGRLRVCETGRSSGVAWHLALFTAVECRMVEEGAAFTVPLRAFKVLVSLRSGH